QDRSSSGGHLRGVGEAGCCLLIAGGAFAVQTGGDELAVGLDLAAAGGLVPAQLGADERGDLVGCGDAAVAGLVVQAGAALEDVGQVAGTLGADRVERLGPQV